MNHVLLGKNILVTSGGTREYIDSVRVVTNISTGNLGAKIAEALYKEGAKVHYVHGVGSKMPVIEDGFLEASLIPYPIKTCQDMLSVMQSLIPAFKMDAVIHCAAVSDFTFRNDGEVKLSSDSAEDFVEYMKKTITRNPKIITRIKEWRPETTLIGFKFTVGKEREELIKIARESGLKSHCDAVFANDKVLMANAKSHNGYFVNLLEDFGDEVTPLLGKENIASHIVNFLKEVLPRKKSK